MKINNPVQTPGSPAGAATRRKAEETSPTSTYPKQKPKGKNRTQGNEFIGNNHME